MERLFAHSPRSGGNEWHELRSHLTSVAGRVAEFAGVFAAGALGYGIGLYHDIGKANPAFQEYLRRAAGGERTATVPHAIWGAALIYEALKSQGDSWKLLALPIRGHHSGLPDGGTAAQEFEEFIARTPEYRQIIQQVQQALPRAPRLQIPPMTGTRREMLVRMLFSALADADYLDTEEHFKPERVPLRTRRWDVTGLVERYMSERAEFLRDEPRARSSAVVQRVREEVFERCMQAARGRPGTYRLTVPTGGGKTRSALGFALKHAAEHGLRRVIFAVPYTSITEQTADVYRTILGEHDVVEHHSQAVERVEEDGTGGRQRLATENWDAPVVVTTTVQLLESLFSNRPGKTRKVHNVARSVVVIDEVQTLPTELLETTADGLSTLVEDYGVSLVLCSATQPGFERGGAFSGLRGEATEIVPEYRRHFAELERVRFELRKGALNWEDVAQEAAAAGQAMVVVNARRDALALLDALGERAGLYHLSTLLCGAHRRKVLKEIRQRLDAGLPTLLMATQVVEAGVDIDFPEVWRAVGPLERIVQAAGRCNREGRWEVGRVVVFEPRDGHAPRGGYQVAMNESRTALAVHGEAALRKPELMQEYFRRLHGSVETDRRRIQEFRAVMDFPEVAARYRLIEETTAIVAPYGEWEEALERYEREPSREAWRRLQAYVVNLHAYKAREYLSEGWIEGRASGVMVWRGRYDEARGLAAGWDPTDLVV